MMPAPCEECVERFADYVEGGLNEEQHAAVRAHLASCAACAQTLREYGAVSDLARRATDATMPPDVALRLRRLLALAHYRRA